MILWGKLPQRKESEAEETMELEDMVKNIDDICGTVLQTASSETSPEIWHMIATLKVLSGASLNQVQTLEMNNLELKKSDQLHLKDLIYLYLKTASLNNLMELEQMIPNFKLKYQARILNEAEMELIRKSMENRGG